MRFILVFIMAFAATLVPHEALAWGPGAHLALGNSVLANLGCLPPLVAELLTRHRNAFLYGCLSADIFIGKGTSFRPGHSHNWVTGFKLFNSVKDPRKRAYAYGYMTHLAADVVAHNYYVPNTLWTMASGSKLSHVYVEAQADRRFKEERESALALFKRPNKDADTSLLSAMEKKRLPFLVKKQLLKGGLKIAGRKEWGRSLKLAGRLLPWNQCDSHLDEMVVLSRNLVFDFLRNPKGAVALSFDPIGSRNLHIVREMRTSGNATAKSLPLFTPHTDILGIAAPGERAESTRAKAANQ